jgi:hypothetical protein
LSKAGSLLTAAHHIHQKPANYFTVANFFTDTWLVSAKQMCYLLKELLILLTFIVAQLLPFMAERGEFHGGCDDEEGDI